MKRLSIFVLMALLAAAFIPAQAQSFVLGEPNGTRLIRNVNSDLAGFTWTALPTATSYDVSVFKISTIPRDTALGEVFTQNVTLANCSATACAYVPTVGQRNLIDRGRYAWTVVANTAGSDVEASNAPLYFSYEPSALALVTNGGFDNGIAPWVGVGLTQDGVKAGVGKNGTPGFEFKGSSTENSKLKQAITSAAYLHIDEADTMVFSVDYLAPKANINGRVFVKITYSNPAIPAAKIPLIATQQLVYFTASANIVPAGHIAKMQVVATNKSLAGKYTIDNVSLVLLGAP